MEIRKVSYSQLMALLAGIYVPMTSNYFTGNWVEKFRVGKITLSIRVGKCRKCVRGRIVSNGYESSRINSGYIILQFQPNIG